MSEKVKVVKRNTLGKKVKKLRKEGLLPANIYGKDMKSEAVELPLVEFTTLFEKVGETGIVEVTLNQKSIPALIHNVQINPLTYEPIHVDFLKINLKEKITAQIPLEITGEAQPVKDGQATLNTPLTEIEVEALPTDLPEKIEVNIESLNEIGNQITVKDITVPKGVEIKTEDTTVIAALAEVKEEEEPEPEPETEAEGEGTETPEGDKPKEAEGDKSTEEKESKEETKKE